MEKRKRLSRTIGQLKKDGFKDLSDSEKEELLKLAEMMTKLRHHSTNVWPQQFRAAFDFLLKNFGWHMRTSMAFGDLEPYLIADNGSIDDYFMNSLDKSLSELKTMATSRFANRYRTIELAFKAHEREEYDLSIPAFLILSDGVFREMTGADIFTKRMKDKDMFIESLKLRNDAIFLAYVIEAVINGNIIGLGFSKEEDLRAYPNVLNRNMIIHGADPSYGTKINSFKAISQFEFIVESVYNALALR